MAFLLPKVEEYLVPSDKLHLKADNIVLSASVNKLGLFHIQIDNLELNDVQNKTIIELPNVEFSYGILQLLTLNYIPKNVFVSNAYLNLTLTKDGRFILEDQEDVVFDEDVDISTLSSSRSEMLVVQDQKIIINDINNFIKEFEVENGDLLFFVADKKEIWNASPIKATSLRLNVFFSIVVSSVNV